MGLILTWTAGMEFLFGIVERKASLRKYGLLLIAVSTFEN